MLLGYTGRRHGLCCDPWAVRGRVELGTHLLWRFCVQVAYNSLFLGEFMQPDWDMFQSLHPAAEFHGAARAAGGCAVYVSDKPRAHDFGVLRKLVREDGSILRARLPGRPTRDCLFVDPARDATSLLKIWNLNACAGIVAAFNCQVRPACAPTAPPPQPLPLPGP